MTVAVTRTRRPRRIAADEAHAWARNLRLGNSYAKLVLSMLTLYVQGDGICFVGVETLAEDTELSTDTVRKRLAWLETVGAIARFPQWIDASGRRNNEGQGKRTTDEIRLLLTADEEDIERRALGHDSDSPTAEKTTLGGDDVAISPRCQQGQQTENEIQQPSVSPRLALCQPSDSGKGLDSFNQEPESPPNPPPGDVRVVDRELEEQIVEFIRHYPAPITNLPRLRTVLSAMTVDERKNVLVAEKGYAAFIAECERKGKPRAVKDADRWVSNGNWQGFVVTGQNRVAGEQIRRVTPDSDEGKVMHVLHRIAHMPRPLVLGGTLLLERSLSPQAMALLDAPPESQWELVPSEDRNACGAWNEMLARELQGKPRPQLITDRNPGGQSGFMAPWRWPPRKDGTIGEVRDNQDAIDGNT